MRHWTMEQWLWSDDCNPSKVTEWKIKIKITFIACIWRQSINFYVFNGTPEPNLFKADECILLWIFRSFCNTSMISKRCFFKRMNEILLKSTVRSAIDDKYGWIFTKIAKNRMNIVRSMQTCRFAALDSKKRRHLLS